MSKKEFEKLKEQITSIEGVKKDNDYYFVNTKFGRYRFYFDFDKRISSIFGKFIDLESFKINWKQPKSETINGKQYVYIMQPNLFTGKMNFHGTQINDFEDVVYRLIDF